MNTPGINPKHLRRALTEIGRAAALADLRLEIAVCHGTCLLTASLAHGRPVPIAVPNGRARALVAEVAEGLRFHAGWLEDDLAPYLVVAAGEGRLVRKARECGVVLSVNESARILAHKVSVLAAARPPADTDAADVARILAGMRAVTFAQVEAIFRRYCPDAEFTGQAREWIERHLVAPRATETGSRR